MRRTVGHFLGHQARVGDDDLGAHRRLHRGRADADPTHLARHVPYLDRVAHVLAKPAPEALFPEFADSALKFELRAWTGDFDRWLTIKSDLNVAVYAALLDAGMEIPFPQREVRLRRD